MGISNMEGSPTDRAQHSVKKFSVTSALGDTEDDTIWIHAGHSKLKSESVIDTESRLVVAEAWGVEVEGGVAANGYFVSLGGDRNVLEQGVVMVVQLYEYTKNH